jgi:hypothetical protein
VKRGAGRHVGSAHTRCYRLAILCFRSLDRITHHLGNVMIHQGHIARRSESSQSDRAYPRSGLIVSNTDTIRMQKICTAILLMTYLSQTSRHLLSLQVSARLLPVTFSFRHPRRRLLCNSYTLPLRIGIVSEENILRCRQRTFLESRYVPHCPFLPLLRSL